MAPNILDQPKLLSPMAARISTGTPWPDGKSCARGSVLLVTAEDDPGDTIRPRLDAHRADVERVHLLAGLHREEIDGSRAELVFSLGDADALETALRRLDDCRLVVIDPVGSFLGAETDAHRDNEVRAVLAPVAKLAENYGAAVLVVMHRRKSAGAVADDTAMGSRAFTGIARSVWHLSRDAENRERRLLLPGKSNLTAEQTGLAFTIGGDPGAVRWEREPVAMTADDAMAQEQGDRGEASALGDAMAWLSDAMAGGPQPGKGLKAAALRDGIAGRTLERAKAKLGVEAGPDGFGGPWVWKLADSASVRQESPVSAKFNYLADTGETVADSVRPQLGDEEQPTPKPIGSTIRFDCSLHLIALLRHAVRRETMACERRGQRRPQR
jgi:putative DNA primase/helicase